MSQPHVGDLPGVLGHELRNPLASAVTTISLLREMVDAGDPRGVMVDRALVDLDRISDLINGWLRVSRGAKAQKSLIAVDELLSSVAARHGAKIVSDPIDVTIDGDRALLERALDNLLENAAQAGANNLRLAAQSLSDEVSIHIEDDGAGIREADVKRIFAAGWSGRGGSGLGLHAVAATMRAHGGRIHCVRLSRGTRFTLQLPLSRLQPAIV